jgi:hypothetical protein
VRQSKNGQYDSKTIVVGAYITDLRLAINAATRSANTRAASSLSSSLPLDDIGDIGVNSADGLKNGDDLLSPTIGGIALISIFCPVGDYDETNTPTYDANIIYCFPHANLAVIILLTDAVADANAARSVGNNNING